MGNHIVDFCCEKAKLVIEIDGSQHYEPEEKQQDRERSKDLQDLGYYVLRFSNREIWENFSGVGQQIHQTIQKRLPEKYRK